MKTYKTDYEWEGYHNGKWVIAHFDVEYTLDKEESPDFSLIDISDENGNPVVVENDERQHLEYYCAQRYMDEIIDDRCVGAIE